MLKDVNDTKRHLLALKRLIKGMGDNSYLFHVNLIRYNSAKGVSDKFESSDESTVKWFKKALQKAGVSVTVKQFFGVDINAACGQLYAKYQAKA